MKPTAPIHATLSDPPDPSAPPVRSPIVEAVATNLHAAVDRLVDELNGADVAYRTEIAEARTEGHEAGKREALAGLQAASPGAFERRDALAAVVAEARAEERAEILAALEGLRDDFDDETLGAVFELIRARAT